MHDMKTIVLKTAIPLCVGITITLIPVPNGLAPNAWHFFAIFAAVVFGLIMEPIPAAAIGLIGVTASALLLVVEPTPKASIQWALGGFSNSTVWLIFAAFNFSLGYYNTGLGRRLGLHLVKRLGSSTLGLGYAVALSDALLAPFMPSNTARSGGTIFPLIRNIPEMYGSAPGETARRFGAYIMWTALAVTCITSSMFVTGLAPNLLALELVKQTVNIDISWTTWMLGFLPVGVILLASTPFLIYKIYPPKIKANKKIPEWAGSELNKMGKMTSKEWIMAGLALLALALWIFGQNFVNATTVALIVICLMLISGIVSWDDIMKNRQAWNALVWFATLVSLAGGLAKVGFTHWLANGAALIFSGIPPVLVMVLLVAVFFFTHYMFASITAHTTAMLPVFLAAGAAIPGMNVQVLVLLLAYSLGIMGILTPYATGPSPIYFGSGYVARKDFWVLGLIFGTIFLVLLLVLGTPYLMAIYR